MKWTAKFELAHRIILVHLRILSVVKAKKAGHHFGTLPTHPLSPTTVSSATIVSL